MAATTTRSKKPPVTWKNWVGTGNDQEGFEVLQIDNEIGKLFQIYYIPSNNNW